MFPIAIQSAHMYINVSTHTGVAFTNAQTCSNAGHGWETCCPSHNLYYTIIRDGWEFCYQTLNVPSVTHIILVCGDGMEMIVICLYKLAV